MHLLIDLDGTLTDPKPGFVSSIQYAMTMLDAAVPEADSLDQYIGPPLEFALQQLLSTADEARVEKGIAYYRERYNDSGMFENSVYENVTRVLESLTDRTESMLLVTSKPTVVAEQILEHFDLAQYINAVYGSDLNRRNGGKSELIAKALAAEHIDNDRAIMIGDRKFDVLGAHSNYMRSIGVLWGYGSKQELLQSRATRLCQRPIDLPDNINALIGS